MGEIKSSARSKSSLWPLSQAGKTWLMIAAIVTCAVVIDQVIKLYIVHHMELNTSHEITSWFQLCYILNPGMAFGIQWLPKIVLTLFRIVAVGFLLWYSHVLIQRKAHKGYIATIALIIAGAMGNIVDCVFYGKLLQGGDWFYGKVVDMFYFPLWTWPDWMPWLGGHIFFEPVFNFADSCITCGVAIIILFFWKELNGEKKEQ